MKKLLTGLLCLMLLCCLIVPVAAESSVSELILNATVSPDGSCQVTQTVTLRLDSAAENLRYPVPAGAKTVSLNGKRVSVSGSGDSRTISLSKIAGGTAGTFTFTVGYRLTGLVSTNEAELLELGLPLLSGFAYPVDSFTFTVAMPAQVGAKPAFSSGYHQASIEKDLSVTYDGSVIRGSSLAPLKDHETLAMTLTVDPEVFPQTGESLPTLDTVLLTAGIIAAFALLYWVFFLRFFPPRRVSATTAPEGCTAGQLGAVLCSRGTRLSLMVLSWAQLGYVLVYLDRHGKVVLHKRMDMGNERTAFERKVFRSLFSRRTGVDTESSFYTQLASSLRTVSGGNGAFLHRRSGNVSIFRGLCSICGLLGWVCLALMLGGSAALQWLLVFLFGAVGLWSSLTVQKWALSLFSFDKRPLYTALVHCGVTLLLGAIAGIFSLTLWMCLGQLLSGVLACFGGRRTEDGRQAVAQTLGLRRYLVSVPKTELQHILSINPEYFHTLAPEALALGVDRRFARRFGGVKLNPCPYMTTGMDGHMTASQWAALLRQVVAAMERRERQLSREKLLQVISNFRTLLPPPKERQ